MQRFARLIARHPVAVIAAIGLVTALALHGIVDLRSGRMRLAVDPGIDRLLPEGDEDRAFFDRVRQVFGSDEFVLLVMESDDLFQPDALARVQRITQRLDAFDGVDRVLSLANASDVRGEAGEIEIGPFFETPPQTAAALAALRARVLAHPVYGGSLVSADGNATAFIVHFDERIPEAEFIERGLSDQVAALAREEAGDARIYVTGSPHVKVELARTILRELRFVLPTILGLAALLSLAAFRTPRGALLPIAAIAISLVWTLGAMGWSGAPLNLVSSLVPPLVITLGFAAAIHVVAEYYELLHHHNVTDRATHRATIERVLEEMGVAVLVNGLTTGLGFASLLVTSVVAIREFGTWSVVGVVATTVVSLTFVPAALDLLGPARRLPREPGARRIDRWAEALARFDVRHRRWILTLALATLAIAVWGMTRIRVATEHIGDFRAESAVRLDFEAINERFGGASAFFVVVESDEDGAFEKPENLRALRELSEWLEAQPEVGEAVSVADNVMLLNRAFNGDDPAAHAIPERKQLVKQLLLFGGDDVTQGFVDARRRMANISMRSKVNDSESVGRLIRRIDARLADLPQRLTGRVTGDLVLLNRTVDAIAMNELQSIGIALLTIYLTLSAMLTSFRIGLVALLPNLLPIAIYYGTLGLLDIPLSLSTSLIGSIALGIAVDDTVHYFARFNLEARRLGSEVLATASTLRSVIRPVTFTTLGLCLGFGVLTFSELKSQESFGALAAFTLAVAWALELTLSPALCSTVRLVTLWDALSFDLGERPQHSIPLFAGLSQRQARIFALLSTIVSAPAGRRLLTEGEPGSDMYVVIDGELAASTERAGQRVEFSRMRRGDVIGEVALFGGARSANVDVVSDARLLRFGDSDLERLGRRYPRIAAKVYRSLSRVLANRVVTTARALR